MPFAVWMDKYNQTIVDIFGNNMNINSQNAFEYFNNKQDPEWSALIYIQENITAFSFDEWTTYIDYVTKLIIGKNSSEIEDLPYYELWHGLANPLLVALYAIFQSSETLADTCLPKDAYEIWNNSNYNNEIKNKIDYIMQHY
mgnify:CR=1 FL=1